MRQSASNRFIIGMIMMIAGGYLLLDAIHIHNNFGFNSRLYDYGGVGITTGYVLIPFIFGIGMLFYNPKNPISWILTGGSIVILVFGVITSIQFRMRTMSSFELLTILVLFVGGIGLFLSSFRGK